MVMNLWSTSSPSGSGRMPEAGPNQRRTQRQPSLCESRKAHAPVYDVTGVTQAHLWVARVARDEDAPVLVRGDSAAREDVDERLTGLVSPRRDVPVRYARVPAVREEREEGRLRNRDCLLGDGVQLRLWAGGRGTLSLALTS